MAAGPLFVVVLWRYSRRHQDDSTRSDRLAAAALGIDDGVEWNGGRGFVGGRGERCYKVRCRRHENGELLTQWSTLNRGARARPSVLANLNGARSGRERIQGSIH